MRKIFDRDWRRRIKFWTVSQCGGVPIQHNCWLPLFAWRGLHNTQVYEVKTRSDWWQQQEQFDVVNASGWWMAWTWQEANYCFGGHSKPVHGEVMVRTASCRLIWLANSYCSLPFHCECYVSLIMVSLRPSDVPKLVLKRLGKHCTVSIPYSSVLSWRGEKENLPPFFYNCRSKTDWNLRLLKY